MNFKRIYKTENKKIDRYGFCDHCKKNLLLLNIDDKLGISYYILSKNQMDGIIPTEDLNKDLKNLIRRVRVDSISFRLKF